jgi:hypothetical protein
MPDAQSVHGLEGVVNDTADVDHRMRCRSVLLNEEKVGTISNGLALIRV